MKERILSIAIALTLLLGLGLMTQTVSAVTYGPKTDNFLIHMYLNSDAENADLEAGLLDIIDWPLTKYWIDKWTGNPDIVTRSYAQGGKREFDLNKQRWPTGLTLPRVLDSSTGTYKHIQNYADPWEVKARDFRRALAYLSDKDGYIDRILKGYGYRMDTTVPNPFLAGYVNLDVSGINYPYRFNPAQAAILLNGAGFIEGTTDNLYYDNTQLWSAQHLRIDPKGDWSVGGAGTDLKGIILYARLDDVERTDAAKELTLMMQKSGIPTDLRIRDRAECSDKVMNVHDFHIYTGGWSLGVYPTWVYSLYHKSRYWGGSQTGFYTDNPANYGSSDYGGFCNPEYDVPAEQAYFTTDAILMKQGVMDSQVIYVRDCSTIDLWAAAAFEAYNSKWTGVVNQEGFGTDVAWSFFNMENSVGDNIIDWGFKSNLEGPHIFNSRWVWDRNVVGLVYDGLIANNPYNYAVGEEVGVTCDFDNPLTQDLYGTPAKTRVTYNLRNDVYFHNGRQMLPYDAAFTLILFRDSGPANYWYYASVGDIAYIEVQNNAPTAWAAAHPHADIRSNPALGPNDMAIYFNVASMWARFWGSQYVMDSYLWLHANDDFGWSFGVKPYKYSTGSGPTPKSILAYKPWEEDVDENDVMDMYEDGTAPLIMDGTSGGTAGTWTWISFHADRNCYWSQEFIEGFLSLAFHNIGNVNYLGATNTYPGTDQVIDIVDGSYIRNSFGSDPAWPHGTELGKWNVDCDFDASNTIFTKDLYLWGSSYGRVSG